MNTSTGTKLLQKWVYVLVLVAGDWLLVNLNHQNSLAAIQEAYGPEFLPFLSAFMRRADEEDWPSGSYYPGGWFRRELQANDSAPPLPARFPATPEEMGPFYLKELLVDAKGIWFSGGKILSGKVLNYFLQQLEYDPICSRYRIRYRLENRFEVQYLHHLSPPFRVRRVLFEEGRRVLLLNNGLKVLLRPDSLHLDAAERLYAGIGAPLTGAWFEEPARWELLKDAAADGGHWALTLEGQTFRLPVGAKWPYADPPPEFDSGSPRS